MSYGFAGTLTRCLESLEQIEAENPDSNTTTEALKQVLLYWVIHVSAWLWLVKYHVLEGQDIMPCDAPFIMFSFVSLFMKLSHHGDRICNL